MQKDTGSRRLSTLDYFPTVDANFTANDRAKNYAALMTSDFDNKLLFAEHAHVVVNKTT